LSGTLNILGCGKLGRTLGRLWSDGQIFSVQDIVNRSYASAQQAVAFVGAGKAVEADASLRPATAWMIAAPDAQIAECCRRIAATGKLEPGSIVFHCSGALSSSELRAAADCGALVASVHPVASFADPSAMLARFDRTWCCIEGEMRAQDVLAGAFTGIGAKILRIDAASKIVYHAGAVFASNYLVALLEVALQAFAASGIPRATALDLMRPLAEGSVANVFNMGTEAALTGPVARGDIALVKRQHAALAARDPAMAELYRQLALVAAKLAGRQLDIE
jgi:predicted short-subunit dehydrogenase-like oxidoreductase (DUF2520 family)